jgi:hypothetical protein
MLIPAPYLASSLIYGVPHRICCVYGAVTLAIGQNWPVTCSPDQPFEWPLYSEISQVTYACNSTEAVTRVGYLMGSFSAGKWALAVNQRPTDLPIP